MNFKKIIKRILIVYLIYCYLFGIFIYKINRPKDTDIEYDIASLATKSDEATYAYSLLDGEFSFVSRLKLIENSKESVDISYYSIEEGRASSIFFGALFVAANRGVKIRLITDGLIQENPFKSSKLASLQANENISFKYYEPLNLLLPHTAQNTLHDKLLIIDETYGVIGGRNIGDRFFLNSDDPSLVTHDRDVIIFGNEDKHSTVVAMKDYYDELFNYKYSKEKSKKENNETRKVEEKLINAYYEYCDNYEGYDEVLSIIKDESIEVDRTTFVRGPLKRLNKNPVVFRTISKLAESYDDIFIQSPYLILNKQVRDIFPNLENKNITVLTNTIDYNSNFFAPSGYLYYRKAIARNSSLYEYQSKSSLHAKTFLMGEDISIVGSLNMDHRSIFLSTESVVIIYSKEYNELLREEMSIYLDSSLKVQNGGSYITNDSVLVLPKKPFRRLILYILFPFMNLHQEMM